MSSIRNTAVPQEGAQTRAYHAYSNFTLRLESIKRPTFLDRQTSEEERELILCLTAFAFAFTLDRPTDRQPKSGRIRPSIQAETVFGK